MSGMPTPYPQAVTPVHVSRRAAARALLSRLGLLSAPAAGIRPWSDELAGQAGAAEALARLRAIQVDPVAAIERNHHLVLMNRVRNYRPADLDELYAHGQVFEHYANARCILPVAQFPAFWPLMRQLARNSAEERANVQESMAEIVARLKQGGPVQARQVGNNGPRVFGAGYNAPDEASKASGHALDLLCLSGDLVVGRNGGTKYYDLTERVLPADIIARLDPPLQRGADGLLIDAATGDGAGPARPWSTPQATAPGELAPWADFLLDLYIDAYHVFEAGDFRLGWQRHPAALRRQLLAQRVAAGQLVPLAIDGVRRPYWATPECAQLMADADDWDVEPDIRFIPPLDNLLWRRERLKDLFGFDYTWEIYYPRHKRRYGYYAMPILYGDRLIGRIDPRLDRAGRHLTIELLQVEPDVRLNERDRARLAQALDRLAAFHDADSWSVSRTEPDGIVLG